MADFGLFILRVTVGTLLAGHGAQKLFGWFEGPGLKGTHGMMEKLGMRPPHVWGSMAATGEFGGGLLTALGFLNPLGPLGIAGSMMVAIRRVHWKLPIWAGKGGAELPMTNLAAALAVGLAGSGKYSLDGMLGIRLPRWMTFLTWLGAAATIATALRRPELAEKVVQQAAQVLPEPMRQRVTPDLEVETRSVATQQEPVTAQV